MLLQKQISSSSTRIEDPSSISSSSTIGHDMNDLGRGSEVKPSSASNPNVDDVNDAIIIAWLPESWVHGSREAYDQCEFGNEWTKVLVPCPPLSNFENSSRTDKPWAKFVSEVHKISWHSLYSPYPSFDITCWPENVFNFQISLHTMDHGFLHRYMEEIVGWLRPYAHVVQGVTRPNDFYINPNPATLADLQVFLPPALVRASQEYTHVEKRPAPAPAVEAEKSTAAPGKKASIIMARLREKYGL